MGKIPKTLRLTIAANIRACRMKKFPGHGGCTKCAKAFGVSPQQWSPWERGRRMPDETRLEQIATLFGVTVEYLRKDHSHILPDPPSSGVVPNSHPTTAEPPAQRSAAMTLPHVAFPSLRPETPGSPESFFRLARQFIKHIMTDGITIRLDRQSAEWLLSQRTKDEPSS